MKIRSFSLQGFRSYGVEQSLEFPSNLAVIHGKNSKGKSSLGEAFEFLLTGKIVRRELVASAQDEFADALRNSHFDPNGEVFVEAAVLDDEGSDHVIRRALTLDYGKRQECQSVLTIDGDEAAEEDLATLGCVLSRPPLQAPILAQHTLAYIFSAGPQERANYFKSLLELRDLDDFQSKIEQLSQRRLIPEDQLIQDLANASTNPILADLSNLKDLVDDVLAFSDQIDRIAAELITSTGEPVPDGLDQQLQKIAALLEERRGRAFNTESIRNKVLQNDRQISVEDQQILKKFEADRANILQGSLDLADLYKSALKLDLVREAHDDIDCPLCLTPHAISPHRIEDIRAHMGLMAEFGDVSKRTLNILTSLKTSIAQCSLGNLLPRALIREESIVETAQILTGFCAGDEEVAEIQSWTEGAKASLVASTEYSAAAKVLDEVLERQIADRNQVNCDDVAAHLDVMASEHKKYANAHAQYGKSLEIVLPIVTRALDQQAATNGWESFISIASSKDQLRTAIIREKAVVALNGELRKAVRMIEEAKEKVLDDKFGDYSANIAVWWELLRPEEASFFSAVKPRPGARRTIDLKVGLAPDEQRTTHKLRDAIAVFSQSQLHCLGLAFFLARAEKEKCGFIVLDDPILSSDEEYRMHFNHSVIERLLALDIQTIVLTQDERSKRDLENVYRHANISMFRLYIDSPSQGTLIEAQGDDLPALIDGAKTLLRGGHPENHRLAAQHLRNGAERFCKEMLLKKEIVDGNADATINDYEGQTLEKLSGRIETLLNRDPSHPGKLRVIRDNLNPYNHDNPPPNKETMKVVAGDLNQLVKDYLSP